MVYLLFCITLTVVLISGCSSSNSNAPKTDDTTDNASTNSTTPPTTITEEKKLEPITFTINTADNKLTWDTPITKKISEATGVTLKYEVNTGDQFQKWDLWLAGGDYPQIVVLDPLHIQKYQEADALIPLNDLIDEYGPNIKKSFGKYYNLLKDDNGQIYSLYAVNQSTEASADTMAPFVVQYDVLMEAGYPEIKTLDQLFDVLNAYKQKHPKIDGQDTIGFGAAAQSYMMNINFNNPIMSAAGLPDNSVFKIDSNNTIHYLPVSEEAKTYYKFLNRLYNAGLFDKEAFSLQIDDLKGKMAQGRVLAAYAPNWTLGDSEKSLRAANKPERAYAHIPIYLHEGIVDRTNTTTPTTAGNFMWAITKGTKNPERIIQFIDYLFTDEAQILTQWGIEGTDYTIVDGHRAVTSELIKNRLEVPDTDYNKGFKGVGTGGNTLWFSVGNGAKLSDGDYATPLTRDFVLASYDDMTKEVLAKYGKKVWADFLPPVEYVPGYVWQLTPPESTKTIAVKIDANWRKHLPKVVLSKNEADFESAWNEMKDVITKDGLSEMEVAYTKIWGDFNSKYLNIVGQ